MSGIGVRISISVELRTSELFRQPTRACEVLEEAGGVEIKGTALLSQEGRTIETAVEIVRGVVPEQHFLGMHS